MSRSTENRPESIVPESVTAFGTFIAGGILVTHIDQGVIGNEYNRYTDQIIPVENQIATLTNAQPLLTTEAGRSDLDTALTTKRSDLSALVEARDQYHAPFGINTEMATDAGLTILATIAAVGIHRAVYRRRHPKPNTASTFATS